MYRNLKENRSYTKTLVLFGILFFALTLGSVLISDILLPVSASMLTLFLLFDKTKIKWLSLSLVAVLLVLVAVISLSSTIFVLIAFICAFVLFYGYYKGLNKAEISIYLSLLYIICTVACLYFIGAKEIGSFHFSEVFQYYNKLFDALVQDLVEQMKLSFANASASGQELGIEQDEFLEMIEQTLRSFSSMFLSVLAIIAFLYAGIQIKLFSYSVIRYEDSPRPRQSWHFALSNVFAYFYIALALVSPFLGTGNGVMAIAIANLYNIFMFVFAYIGFNYALHFLSHTRKKGFARFVFIVFLIMANMVAIQILSFIGVFITTMHNKFMKINGGENDSPKE